jgi:transcription-repair coupling factor (superfamily II helicase)
MDIRGYGNLVGEEQSGHIKEVGVELYQQMLADAVAQLQEQPQDNMPANNDWSPVINLGIPMQIPASYIADMNLRLTIYRQIASIDEHEELHQQRFALVDRFGALPLSVEYLLRVIEIKWLAKQLHLAKIDRGEKGILLTFRPQASLAADALLEFVYKRSNVIKMRPDNKMLLLYTWQTAEEVLSGLAKTLRAMAECGKSV